MFRRLLLAFALLVPVTLAAAQETPPPLLDAPDHWQIHDANGAMTLQIDAEYMFTDDAGSDYYDLQITGTINGQRYSNWAIAVDHGDGQVLDVYNNDSQQWTQWRWNVDHYDKIGGTSNRRSYYPVYL